MNEAYSFPFERVCGFDEMDSELRFSVTFNRCIMRSGGTVLRDSGFEFPSSLSNIFGRTIAALKLIDTTFFTCGDGVFYFREKVSDGVKGVKCGTETKGT